MKSDVSRKRACRVQRHAGAESPEGPALGPFGGGVGAAPPHLYLLHSAFSQLSQKPPYSSPSSL